MTDSGSNLRVARLGADAVVRVCGRASFTCSASFKSVVQRLTEHAVHRFILDLTDCILMDSTFLGVLANFARGAGEKRDEPRHWELLNTNARVLDQLENLGVGHLFELRQGRSFADVPCVAVEGPPPSKRELAETCLEAHRTLIELNPENWPKLKDAVNYLEEDVKRLQNSPGGSNGG
jgi:anti-sigma B factor antagonist